MLALLSLVLTAGGAPETPDVVAHARAPVTLTTAVATATGAALGGATLPLAAAGVGLGGVALGSAVVRATVPPPPPGRGLAAGEGWAECVGVPAAIFFVGGAELLGAAASLGATALFAYAGALPSGEASARDAAGHAVLGSCGGCLAGTAGLCAYSCATSTTTDLVTTMGPIPQPAGALVLTGASALGAAAAATVPLFIAPDAASMAY